MRLRAIRLLDECDDVKLIPTFLKILAATRMPRPAPKPPLPLGKYIELGELEELPAKTQRQVEDALLEKANSEDQLIVRRNCPRGAWLLLPSRGDHADRICLPPLEPRLAGQRLVCHGPLLR